MDVPAGKRRLLPLSEATEMSFLLLPRFSMLALTAAIEPLRHANAVLGQPKYRWAVYSVDGEPVASSSGLELMPAGNCDDIDLTSIIILCAGPDVVLCVAAPLRQWLRRAARHSPMIGGLCTAQWLLADAGLLDGYTATIHWEMASSFREAHPNVTVSDSLYEFDRDRITCAGEGAGVDMMVTLLAHRHGPHLAANVAAQVLHERVRAPNESQSVSQLRYATRSHKLLKAIELMEANLEDPLELDTIIARISGSRRQIERLFERHLQNSPIAFYRNLRLDKARQLITSTRMSSIEVAVACGFRSVRSFSLAYERRFGVSPHREIGIPAVGGTGPLFSTAARNASQQPKVTQSRGKKRQ